jgi:hypothetical protein
MLNGDLDFQTTLQVKYRIDSSIQSNAYCISLISLTHYHQFSECAVNAAEHAGGRFDSSVIFCSVFFPFLSQCLHSHRTMFVFFFFFFFEFHCRLDERASHHAHVRNSDRMICMATITTVANVVRLPSTTTTPYIIINDQPQHKHFYAFSNAVHNTVKHSATTIYPISCGLALTVRNAIDVVVVFPLCVFITRVLEQVSDDDRCCCKCFYSIFLQRCFVDNATLLRCPFGHIRRTVAVHRRRWPIWRKIFSLSLSLKRKINITFTYF